VPELRTLGWDDTWSAVFEPHAASGLVPGRVAIRHRGAYDVLAEDGDVRAKVSPSLRRGSAVRDLPAVGDWVALAGTTIEAILPRRTTFSRRAARGPAAPAREQVVAANVDVVFVTFALAGKIDRLVLERYVALALESGARPVLLLTKSDLEPAAAAVAGDLHEVGGEIPIHTLSARAGAGLEQVHAYLREGVTGALLGPSGAGKSTLVNALLGDERLATGDVRADGTGRHTTTRRELVLLPGGGLIVDNPGMREVHLWLAGDGLAEAFEDVHELAAGCRFSDCRHETEPGCAVQAAVADGTLPRERWERFQDLRTELEELEARLERDERSRPPRG
jgi:ribosome biogenesis GTPase / thiamine phosphate phosphatase